MRVMEANLRLADAGVEKSWVNFKPKVNVAFQYGWEKNSTLSLDGIKPWALMLSISYPIFSGFSDFTGVEKARYELKRTEAQVEGFRRGLLMQATNARLSVRAARQRMGTARKGQEQALDVLNSVTRRYETGGASNVDLLDVQTAYTSAKTDYIAAVYDYLIAGVQVARATGTISR
jgi:outer membrane protein TolC